MVICKSQDLYCLERVYDDTIARDIISNLGR